MIGKSNLLYHRFIDDKIEIKENIYKSKWINLNYNILINVDHIVFESLTHYYKIPSRRALEFCLDSNDFVSVDLKYWDVRHKGIENLHPIEWKRRNALGDSWYEKLSNILNYEHMTKLSKFVQEERKRFVVYPEPQDVFKAFRLTSFDHTKVVIIGQNPYYTKDTADGLAFSFKSGLQQPNQKALNVIFDEIERDVYKGFVLNRNYDLSYLSEQGVLLLNSSLTVIKNNPNSHLGIGWERFISYVLQLLWLDKKPKVFIPLGNYAQNVFDDALRKCEKRIGFEGFNYHSVLKARHPAYDVRLFNSFGKCEPNFPETFGGSEVFSRANSHLVYHNRRPIEWMDL
jgi:uracil-DNA glycosylase